jgi:hypothetical protein
MKKILVFAAVLSAFTFASCKKDRSCTCTSSSSQTVSWTTVKDYDDPAIANSTTSGSDTYSDADAGTITFVDAKKKDAKKACIDNKSENEEVDVTEQSNYDYINGNIEFYTATTTTTTKYTSDNACSLK